MELGIKAVALLGAAGMALGVALMPRWSGPVAAPELVELTQHDARRCTNCGWIESKREVLPGIYEYTVRMGDGSSSVFREALPVSWRLGERLMVIEGSR